MELSTFVPSTTEILREALMIFSKNGKLIMFPVTMLTLLINSLLYCSNIFFFAKPLDINNLLINPFGQLSGSSASGPEFANLLIVNTNTDQYFDTVISKLDWICILANSITFSFLATATIFASSSSLAGEQLNFKDLMQRVVKSCKRPFFILTFTNALGLEWFLVAFIFKAIAERPVDLAVLAVLVPVLYIYISAFCALVLMASVLEAESCSYKEFTDKAFQVAKGVRKQGFVLNLVFTVSAGILVQGVKLVDFEQDILAQIVVGFFVSNLLSLIRIFWLVAFTVLYHECKKKNGEAIVLPGTLEYVKVPGSEVDGSIP